MTEGAAARAGTGSPHGVDSNSGRLDAFLRDRFPELSGRMSVERTVGGMSNPTYFITYNDWSVVLRKQPDSTLLRSAHSIDREFRVLSALQGSAVPVPKPILYCTEPDIVGTPFYLMERLRGRVFSDNSLPTLEAPARLGCYESMCRTLAALHAFDWRAAGLADYGRPGNYFQRQLSRWSQQWQQFRSDDNPYVDQLIDWLQDKVPPSDTVVVCHGDFRIANLDRAIPEFTCLFGTLVQEVYATHPELRDACDQGMSAGVAALSRDIAEAKQKYAPDASWSAESVAYFIQSVVQGGFILAKAKQDPQAAAQVMRHARRYLEMLLRASPDDQTEETKA